MNKQSERFYVKENGNVHKKYEKKSENNQKSEYEYENECDKT